MSPDLLQLLQDPNRVVEISDQDVPGLLLKVAALLTEERLEQLVQAQRRTEEATRSLAQAVGQLSDTVGYGLEDIARVILPGYLERHFGIRVGELERRFVGSEGNEVEIIHPSASRAAAERGILLVASYQR